MCGTNAWEIIGPSLLTRLATTVYVGGDGGDVADVGVDDILAAAQATTSESKRRQKVGGDMVLNYCSISVKIELMMGVSYEFLNRGNNKVQRLYLL